MRIRSPSPVAEATRPTLCCGTPPPPALHALHLVSGAPPTHRHWWPYITGLSLTARSFIRAAHTRERPWPRRGAAPSPGGHGTATAPARLTATRRCSVSAAAAPPCTCLRARARARVRQTRCARVRDARRPASSGTGCRHLSRVRARARREPSAYLKTARPPRRPRAALAAPAHHSRPRNAAQATRLARETQPSQPTSQPASLCCCSAPSVPPGRAAPWDDRRRRRLVEPLARRTACRRAVPLGPGLRRPAAAATMRPSQHRRRAAPTAVGCTARCSRHIRRRR